MYRKPLAALIAASSFVALAGIAQAQSSPRASDTSRSASGVEYTTGGIGLAERQELASEARQFNTHLEFVYAPEGEYLAEVHVDIADARGNTVLSTTTDGPWLLAKLPAGRYTVKASFGGVTRTQQINVGGGKRRVVMRFPASVGQQDIAGSSSHPPSMAHTR
jgi:hypothetical protein